MFESQVLKDKLETSHVIENQQQVWFEINMNQSYNISKVGNYRYRPNSSDPIYGLIKSNYDASDVGNYYTGATDSDTIIDAGFNDNNTAITLTSKKEKIKLMYSLEDCFKQNRPRSGINKLLYLGISGASSGSNQYIDGITSANNGTINIARRPRYYMSSRYDDFKYWTSYRTEILNEQNQEFGISLQQNTGTSDKSYYIQDVAPFVIYKEAVPANRVAIKMQTNIGEVNNGPYRFNNNENVADPFYGLANRTVPRIWRIQALNANNDWVELISFSESQTRSDGNPIIASDGQVEIEYGLIIPTLYQDNYTFVGEISSISMRPDLAPYGYAYLLKSSDVDKGVLHISDGSNWQTYEPNYSWSISGIDITKNTKVIKQFTDPEYFISNNVKVFREFQFLYGLRIVVDTMNKKNCTFDLIELSPRLVGNITNKVQSFSIKKTLSDLGTFSLPTGSLLASTGSMSIFDDDLSFNENNVFNYETATGSVISAYSNNRMKFIFYDIVKNINNYDYYIPMKTMYSERIPQVNNKNVSINIELRDLFFLLESKKSPEILLRNVSLSYAITVLLDNIGFSNYVFKRTSEDEELIIPFFFVGPDQNIAETLQQLAMSSQSAIFFDEYNNLVIMSKNYLLPSSTARSTDMTLYAKETQIENKTILPNIVNISSQEKKTFNGGEIRYTTRYIQKSVSSIAQAPYNAEYQSYVYKPVLLWEVAGQENVRTINESAQQSSGYSLSAMPIKTTLSANIPEYYNGEIINNIIDFGENIYWLANYSGYFYANSEIIRYDAVEYSVAGVGNVWIENNQQYQDYFSKLSFNGKMYPTGNVRIYANVQNDIVKEHGRGQFGTAIVEHKFGIDPSSEWTNNIRGIIQNAKDYLFNTNATIYYPNNTGIEEAGNNINIGENAYSSQSYAANSTRNGIIKNFLANTTITEKDTNSWKSAFSGSVQTSALVFNGPQTPSDIKPSDFVSYAYKTLDKPYRNFGTRMRIIGKIESGTNNKQTAAGSFDIYPSNSITSSDPSKQVSISGGSGGIGFNINKDTNVGYYFEISALSQNSISSYRNNSNSASYTIATSPVTQTTSDSVIVTLTTQHDFEIGNKVIVSGLIDDNLNTNSNTPLNGQFIVTDISIDRKQFTYKIIPPTNLTASITNVSGNGTTVTYTSANSFSAGQKVTITGTGGYAISNGIIASATSTQFTITSTATSGTATSATYIPLTTTSKTGGTVTRVIDSDTLISNVFFYKIVSGSNTADIIKKYKSSNTVTLTTLRQHSFVVGENIVVSIGDSNFDGTYKVTAVDSKTISYVKSGDNVSLTDLSTMGLVTGVNKTAIPQIIWRGFTDIIVDDGKFTTQQRLTSSEKTTVYDLSVEYLDFGTTRTFYLYLNDKRIAVVDDTDPLPKYNNIALFVRGSSRIMFENIHAISDNFAENETRRTQLPIVEMVSSENDPLRKYSINNIIQNSYLSGISSESPPQYDLYYEEFGTIMREAAYFNIKYDRAYPALYAKLMDTINRVKGYTISGFIAGSYGAEFLIFNAVDKNLNLDDTTGNYLRISGISFTQNTTHSLKVDDFFKKNSNMSESIYSGSNNADQYQRLYSDLINSRNKYGRSDFSIDAQYVQTTGAAESMMDWIIKKVIYPKKTIGVETFATPHLQLGDIVNISYKDSNDISYISDETTRFVVYNIEYKKENASSSTVVYLAEV